MVTLKQGRNGYSASSDRWEIGFGSIIAVGERERGIRGFLPKEVSEEERGEQNGGGWGVAYWVASQL